MRSQVKEPLKTIKKGGALVAQPCGLYAVSSDSSLCCPHYHLASLPHAPPGHEAHLQEGVHLLLDPIHEPPLDDQAVGENRAGVAVDTTTITSLPSWLPLLPVTDRDTQPRGWEATTVTPQAQP